MILHPERFKLQIWFENCIKGYKIILELKIKHHQMDTTLKQILKNGICKDNEKDGNRIKLKISDVRRKKVGELSNVEYKELISRLESDGTLSIKSIDYIKIARYKEKNRLSSKKYNDKEKEKEDKLREEIKELESYREYLKREKTETTREIADYKYIIQPCRNSYTYIHQLDLSCNTWCDTKEMRLNS